MTHATAAGRGEGQVLRIVIALGGNALIERGQPLTVDTQRRNIARAVQALAPLARQHQIILTHGNGPQVGLLALQAAAYQAGAGGAGSAVPLDVLGAEREGMVGYLIEQGLANVLPERACATLLTQVLVNADDPAFAHPSKPIGPLYDAASAQDLQARLGWQFGPDGGQLRRLVPSPKPQAIVELSVIKLLLAQDVIVICAGGGGIPVTQTALGRVGVEAVIDKDHASALLARELNADLLLLLTDVAGVFQDWGLPTQTLLSETHPEALDRMTLPAGSMGPKIAAAADFVRATGARAVIGALDQAEALVAGSAGTQITPASN